MDGPKDTTCAVCHRCVFTHHVDDRGRCCFCRPVDAAKGQLIDESPANELSSAGATDAIADAVADRRRTLPGSPK